MQACFSDLHDMETQSVYDTGRDAKEKKRKGGSLESVILHENRLYCKYRNLNMALSEYATFLHQMSSLKFPEEN